MFVILFSSEYLKSVDYDSLIRFILGIAFIFIVINILYRYCTSQPFIPFPSNDKLVKEQLRVSGVMTGLCLCSDAPDIRSKIKAEINKFYPLQKKRDWSKRLYIFVYTLPIIASLGIPFYFPHLSLIALLTGVISVCAIIEPKIYKSIDILNEKLLSQLEVYMDNLEYIDRSPKLFRTVEIP